MGIDEGVWRPTVYAKNGDRLFDNHITERFLTAILNHRRAKPLLSEEHSSVDGSLFKRGHP